MKVLTIEAVCGSSFNVQKVRLPEACVCVCVCPTKSPLLRNFLSPMVQSLYWCICLSVWVDLQISSGSRTPLKEICSCVRTLVACLGQMKRRGHK